MKHLTQAKPQDEIQNAMLADQVWNEVCEHCIHNIDRQLITTGVNAQNNLRYGRYYSRFSTDQALMPDVALQDLNMFNKFVGTDVYFIRSLDMPTAKTLPYFTVCVSFVKESKYTSNGTFALSIGGHPTIAIFVRDLLKVPTSYLKVIEAFKALSGPIGSQERSTFVHEFTHMLDNGKYDLADAYSRKTLKTPADYINLNHEINARYMQIVHNILDRLSQIGILDEIHQHFPTFNEFYAHYWSAQSGAIPPQLLDHLTPQNKKRLRVRLYGFYRFLVESEMRNKVDPVNALHFAQEQVIAD